MSDQIFHSLTFGDMDLYAIKQKLIEYMAAGPEDKYRIIIGSDSQPRNDEVDFVSAILIHRIGKGGIYFWRQNIQKKKYVLRDRIYEEASMSISLADEFMNLFKNDGIHEYDLEIHVDIGMYGETKELINEVVGMIRGSGYNVKIKPDSYGASKVADRHT